MQNKFFKSIIVFLISITYSSPGDASAIFLLISPGASAVGTGEAQVAKADDAYASYFNPAGLGFQTGTEYAGMHVNWLPGLADDIYYEFIAYKKHIPWLGTVGGNFTFLNLGEQQSTDEFGNSLGKFRSYMWAATASYGTKINESSAWGANFKIIYQKLADEAVAAETGSGKPYSTDFAFDVGYLKKYFNQPYYIGKVNLGILGKLPLIPDTLNVDANFLGNMNLGLSISNIGPEVDFIDKTQADPLPTNLKMGFHTDLYQKNNIKLSFLFDANKMLVARYESMDWNDNGIIESGKEEGFFDPWHKAIYTSWLDDWYYGGDRNILNNGLQDVNADGNAIIGGYAFFDLDGVPGPTTNGEMIPTLEVDVDGDQIYDPEDGDEFLDFDDPNYGIYNSDGVKEKGTGDERSFSDELEDMVYNIGLEFWYTDNFAIRLGYLHDREGNLKHPTLGAGINFGQYGFDLGYILGKEGEPRSNTLLFSLNMSLDALDQIAE